MPIVPFLQGQPFEPDAVHAMGIAFDDACQRLGLTDKTDPLTRMVAQTIIKLAQRGIKDANVLTEAALKEIERPKPPAKLDKTA